MGKREYLESICEKTWTFKEQVIMYMKDKGSTENGKIMRSEPLKTLKEIQLPIRCMSLKFGRIILHSSIIELMD